MRLAEAGDAPRAAVCTATTGFDRAQALVAAEAVPLGAETVPLARAGGRVLARAVVARLDMPRRDTAAMDGFAVRAKDLAAGLTRYRLRGASYAGGATPDRIAPGTA